MIFSWPNGHGTLKWRSTTVTIVYTLLHSHHWEWITSSNLYKKDVKNVFSHISYLLNHSFPLPIVSELRFTVVCWSLSQVVWGESKVTTWTSRQLISGPHSNKQPFALTFSTKDNLTSHACFVGCFWTGGVTWRTQEDSMQIHVYYI